MPAWVFAPGMTDDLPTARTMAPTGFRVHVWCKACRHSGNVDLEALIRAGKGDIPLVQRARCRSSSMTDFVVTGAHFGPSCAGRTSSHLFTKPG